MSKVNTATDIGPKRSTNEDCLACLEHGVYVIADGMGGCAAGEIASRMLVDTVRDYLQMQKDNFYSELVLKKAILLTNEKIIQTARRDSSLHGMGTTASICQYISGQLYWAHVGDSRIYLLHDGVLTQLTEDHSLVFDLLKNGSITPEQAKKHPQRNLLTRAVGAEEMLAVDTGRSSVNTGDKLLLCTDGLSGFVDDREIAATLLQNTTSDKAADLVQLALDKGSTDNISVIVVEI